MPRREGVERAFASADLIEDVELLVLSDARRRGVYSARLREREGYWRWRTEHAPPPNSAGGDPASHRLRRRPGARGPRRARLDHHSARQVLAPVPLPHTLGVENLSRRHLRPVPARLGRKVPPQCSPASEAGRTSSAAQTRRAEEKLNERREISFLGRPNWVPACALPNCRRADHAPHGNHTVPADAWHIDMFLEELTHGELLHMLELPAEGSGSWRAISTAEP